MTALGCAVLALVLSAAPPMNRLQSGPFLIDYPATRPRLGASFAEMLQASAPLPGLPAAAPAYGKSIRIILADSDAHFDAITGGIIPEWGAGVAIPAEGIIVMPGYGGGRGAAVDLRRTLRHELAHIALHRQLAPARIPRWFNEGYATWVSGALDMEGGWQLRIAFATNRAPPLDSLELSWPRATGDARIAYLLSASVVEYLVRQSGEHALTLFLQRWRSSQNIEQALASTYGISLDQLETHWRRDVRKRYGWFAVASNAAIFSAGATMILLVLFAIRRRRDRRKLALLRASEPPDMPAYWNEDEDAVDEPDWSDQN